jgi:subtilisin family serine protease/flagellar hook assembly protein FlgD
MIRKKLTIALAGIFVSAQLNVPLSIKAETSSQIENSTISLQPEQERVSEHTNEVIIKYKDDDLSSISKIKAGSKSEVKKIMDKYKNNNNVELVQPNYIYKAFSTNDTYRSQQWGLDLIEAEPAWSLSPLKGQGVKVAVLDSGIDLDHEDLAQNIIGGYNAITPGASYNDDNGHGTHAAGIIAAIPGNGKGIAGVAGKASLLAVKVLDADGLGTSESISKGIIWSADNGANIINLSLGTDQEDPLIKDAVDYAYIKGCTIVAASGNDFSNYVAYPAAYDTVIAVSAVNEANGLADFSNYGPEVDVAAPGVNIISTVPNHQSEFTVRNYARMDGTSMAAPFVSGLAALIKAENPSITPEQLRQKLIDTAYDLGPAGNDIAYGYGLINSVKAFGGKSTGLYKELSGDSLEDNNSYINALSYYSTTNINSNIYPSGDIDWYKLVVPAGISAKVEFVSPMSATNQIYILDSVDEDSNIVYETIGYGDYKFEADARERTFYAAVMDEEGAATSENYSLRFEIDSSIPIVNITGVVNGKAYNQNVTPLVTVINGTYEAKLNDIPYKSGTVIDKEGSYVLQINASNEYGKQTESITTFTIDKTAPKVTVSGVQNGAIYSSQVVPKISSDEGTVTALLNGTKYNSDTPIGKAGSYKLDVEAVDAAGNRTKVSISFNIDSGGPKLQPVTTYYSYKLSSQAPIKFVSSEAGKVKIKIYDSRWRLVKEVPGFIQMNSGENIFYWDRKDSRGRRLTSGLYYANISGSDLEGNPSNAINSAVIFDSTSPYPSLYSKYSSYKLYSNAQVRLKLSEGAYVTAGVYNSKGQLVRQFSSNEYRNAGYSYYSWDGKNSSGSYSSRGTYYVKFYTKDLAGNTSYSYKKFTIK